MPKAIVRKHIEKIEGVARTWFEWDYTADQRRLKTLVVEVAFDTDPNEPSYRQNVMDAIEETAKEVLNGETTMAVHYLRIVPRH